MTVDNLGRIRWNPLNANVGVNPVKLTVTDSRGGKIVQEFDLAVLADLKAPQVELYIAENPVSVGDIATFFVNATDNVAVKDLSLKVNGVAVAIDTNGVAKVKMNSVGDFSAVIKATDAAGNIGQQNLPFSVLNFGDVDAPEISLNLTSDTVFTSPTPISGTITDTNLLYYKVEVRETSSDEWKEIARKNDPVVNGVLVDFDPSLLSNDAYDLRFSAYDAGGNITYATRTVNVTGDLKLGNFQLSFNDLAIPVTGIPINLTRTYDTLTAPQKDDFGYGWRLEFRDTDLRTSIGKDEGLETLGVRSVGFSEKTKVYITLPGGKRESFTFKAKDYNPLINAFLNSVSNGGNGDPSLYVPSFVSEAGNTSTLSVESALIVRGANNQFYGASGGAYNPADKDYGFGGYYLLTTKEGIKYRINATTGDLDTITDTNGNVLTFSDGGISSSSGVKVTFERDAEGKIREVIDPSGERIKYDYDSKGDLIAVTDRNGNKTRFEYNNQQAHYLDKIIDPLGRTGAKTEYNQKGQLVKVINAAGKSIAMTYDPDNFLQTTLDGLGNPTTVEYDTRGNVVRAVDALGNQTFMEYDNNNNVIKVTDPNNLVTQYKYDSQNNLISRTEAAPSCGCGAAPGVTYYTYNQLGQQTNIILPTGASLKMDYDNRGNMLSMKDGEGNLINSYVYDNKGQVISETDSYGTVTYTYDSKGNVIESKGVDDSITKMEYDPSGLLIKMIEADGSVSTFTYDKEGREIRDDYGDGNWIEYNYSEPSGEWTSLKSSTIGQIERKFTDDGKLAGWVTAEGKTISYIYDAAGRLWKEITADGNVTEYTYDAAGRLIKTKDLTTGATLTKVYDAGGRITKETDSEGNSTSYIYALDGKLASMTNARGFTWTYSYTGNSTTITDPLGRKTTSVLDDYYLPNETIYDNGSKESASYLYNNNLQEAEDYPTSIVDIGGNDRKFTYNNVGQMISATDLGNGTYNYATAQDGSSSITSPTGETLKYSYDEKRNLTKITYGDNTVKQFSYGAVNRLSKTTLPNGETISYTYDSAGREIKQTLSTGEVINTTYNGEGSVATMTNSTGTTTYHYNLSGSLSGIDYPSGSSIKYEYDIKSRVVKVTEKASPSSPSAVTQYTYDEVGNIKTVTDPVGGVTLMTYDAVNRLTEKTLPSGVKSTYTYNDLDQIMSIVHKKADGTVITSVTYERIGIGEPTKITREDGSYVNLTYDSALRLTSESYYNVGGVLQEQISYTYDASGKRTTKIDSNGSHNYNYGAGYQLISVNEQSETENYNHDTNGRVSNISRDANNWNLEYDAFDHLTGAKNQTTGEEVKYQYDAQGRRVGAINGTETRKFLVAPAMGTGLESTELIANEVGNLLANYVYAGSSPIMRLDESGNPVYYLTDAMGSVIGLTDSTGASIGNFVYDGFGNIRNASGSGLDTGNLEGDFRFQGQWLESDTGLYYFRARDYDAPTGTFLSRDPVDIVNTQPESFHPYQFAYNNPYVYSDPTGMITVMELNARETLENVVQNGIRTYSLAEIEATLGHTAKKFLATSLFSALRTFVPDAATNYFQTIQNISDAELQGTEFEKLLRKAFCDLADKRVKKYVYFEVSIELNEFFAVNDGYQCPPQLTPPKVEDTKRPDFIITQTFPKKKGDPDENNSLLVGDIKLRLSTIYNTYFNPKFATPDSYAQWNAIVQYGKRHGTGFIGFVTMFDGGGGFFNEFNEKTIKQKGLDNGVHVLIATAIGGAI